MFKKTADLAEVGSPNIGQNSNQGHINKLTSIGELTKEIEEQKLRIVRKESSAATLVLNKQVTFQLLISLSIYQYIHKSILVDISTYI